MENENARLKEERCEIEGKSVSSFSDSEVSNESRVRELANFRCPDGNNYTHHLPIRELDCTRKTNGNRSETTTAVLFVHILRSSLHSVIVKPETGTTRRHADFASICLISQMRAKESVCDPIAASCCKFILVGSKLSRVL